MQAIFETLFDVVYLATVITLGVVMIRGSRGKRQYLRDEPFRFLWLMVVLSFACYIPACCSGVCSFGTGNRCKEKYGICCQAACCRRLF